MDIGGGIDEFWLRGDLRISPLEQLDFLEDFAKRELPFQPEVMSAVADTLIREQGDDWTWSYKTGTTLGENPELGWLVGLTEHEDPVKIERDLMEIVPRDDWNAFGLRMIQLGRYTCTARKPKCDGCPLESLCPSAHTFD